jgi:hypothetical protein
MKNEGVRKIVATGYELEMLHSTLERMKELYEFPQDVQEALDDTSNTLQGSAVALDMVDSLQTTEGALRRSFNEQELVDLQTCVNNARKIVLKAGELKVMPAIDELDRAWKIISHPDQD